MFVLVCSTSDAGDVGWSGVGLCLLLLVLALLVAMMILSIDIVSDKRCGFQVLLACVATRSVNCYAYNK